MRQLLHLLFLILAVATASLPLRAEDPVEGPRPLARPGAYELLDRIRQAYDDLELYADRGQIEVLRRGPDGLSAERFEFRTWKASPDLLRFEIERRKTLWAGGGESYLFDRTTGEYRSLPSLEAELYRLPEVEGAALLVARLLAAGGGALEDPEAASIDGSGDCGGGTCWKLDLSYGSGVLLYRLWVDAKSHRVRYLKLERRDPADVVARAMADAAPDAAGGREGPSVTVRVTHEIEAAPERAAVLVAASFQPPPGAARVEVRRAGEAGTITGSALGGTAPTTPDPAAGGDPGRASFGEQVTVRLASVSLRAVDRQGHPLEDLAPEDFVLEIGGEQVPVESVDWVSSSSNPLAEISPAELVEHDIVVPPPGKLVVLFVQSDMHPLRAKGHLKMLDHIPELLDGLHRDDHVAVVSFDSHLKLQLDLTRDTSQVHDAVLAGIRGERAEWPQSLRPPSLAHDLDRQLAKRAATPERGLELTADALAAQGERDKVIVFLGWGLGRFGAFGVTETHAFRAAEDALQRASIPLFVLDITDADNHTLEVALSEIAWSTGGAYIKTYLFPGQAATRIAASMTGHYRLYYAPPEDTSPKARLKIRLANRKGTILLASGAGR